MWCLSLPFWWVARTLDIMMYPHGLSFVICECLLIRDTATLSYFFLKIVRYSMLSLILWSVLWVKSMTVGSHILRPT